MGNLLFSKLAILLGVTGTFAVPPSGFPSYSFDPLRHLAGISPYFDPETPPKYPGPPRACNVTRAAYLIRHAAIYANDFDYETYIEPFAAKLGNHSIDWSQTSDLQFLSTWQTPIEDSDVEELSRVGQLEAMQLGIDVSSRYTFDAPARLWASSSDRTVASAQSFIRGLVKETNGTELVSVYESEEAGANSLTPHHSCPNFSASRGSEQSSQYMDLFTGPIAARFNSEAGAFNFTAYDVYGMMQLCGYETVIRGESPFCDLFSSDEWLAFEYTNDIMYHYQLGYGNDLTPYLGIPYVNATTQLLTTDSTDQNLYVSFTHREEPPYVLAALNLFNSSTFTGSNDPNASFPLDQINHQRVWKSSGFIPFLGNVAIERLECEAPNDGEGFVRVLVNSSPQPLPGCASGPAESCPLNDFVDMIRQRSQLYGGFSEACDVEYSNSTDTLNIFNSSSWDLFTSV